MRGEGEVIATKRHKGHKKKMAAQTAAGHTPPPSARAFASGEERGRDGALVSVGRRSSGDHVAGATGSGWSRLEARPTGRKYNRVAVLFGGPSAEREVSLRSGRAVAKGLAAAGYRCVPVDLPGHELSLPAGSEAVFIALHGEYGEDGQVQAGFDRQGMPYTGSGSQSSYRCMDKRESKRVFRAEGIPTPDYEVLAEGEARSLSLPLVVKPVAQGSSIGVHRVCTDAEWAPAMADALTHGAQVLVEAFIPGRELTVGIVDGDVLPVVEIIAPDAWYDYRAKYTKGQTRYVVPADLDAATTDTCRELAWRAFRALGCRGFGRVDFRLSPAGAPYVLEINTIPGFTETSLLPKAAASAGIGFADLCDRIMNTAAFGP